MASNKTFIGGILVLLGIALYLKNFSISMSTSITLAIGLMLLFAWLLKREQPYMIFGGIVTTIGLVSLLDDLRLLRINITFEVLLVAMGLIFIILYYSRGISGFIFPGCILPAVGVYFILLRTFGERYTSSSIFLLLGVSFYVIYFIEYFGKSNWPLIPANILLIVGILAYLKRLGIVNLNILYRNWAYIWPVIMIMAGIIILINTFFRKKQ